MREFQRKIVQNHALETKNDSIFVELGTTIESTNMTFTSNENSQ